VVAQVEHGQEHHDLELSKRRLHCAYIVDTRLATVKAALRFFGLPLR